MKNTVSVTKIIVLVLAVIMMLSCAVGCTGGEQISESKITEVKLSGSEKDEITVKAQFTDNVLSSLSKKAKLYLFEYTSDMDVASSIEGMETVAEVKARSSVSFEIPLLDGVRSRRYSSFAVASYNSDTKTYNVLTPIAAIRFDANVSDADGKKAPELSIKGLATDMVSGALDLGISHALVSVDIHKLLVKSWIEDAVPYVYGGVTYYMRKSELDRIDGLVREYTDNGVNVYLEFVLGSLYDSEEGITNFYTDLGFAGANEASGYLVNMESGEVARLMEGMFDFLARRYSDKAEEYNGLCDQFVVGKNMNNSKKYASCGGLSMREFIVTYEKLVRAADTALATYNTSGHAYISIDDNWSETDTDTVWQGQLFLSAFATEAATRGDYDWHVACGLYTDSSVVWEHNTAPRNLTPETLANLTDLLDVKKYKFNETDRRGVMIHSFSIPGDVEENQAASYIYAYYCAIESGFVEAMMYSSYDGSSSGLVLGDTLGSKAIYEVFKIADTDDSQAAVNLASSVIGLPFSQLASSLGDKAHTVTRTQGAATVGADTAKIPVLYSFNGDSCGFKTTLGVKYAEFVYSDAYGASYMNMVMDARRATGSEGIYAEINGESIKGADELIIPLYAGSSASSAKSNSVTLRIIRPSKGAVSDANGTVLYQSTATGISGSVWQNVSFDVSEFTDLVGADDTLILSLTASSADGGYFGVKDIYVDGASGGGDVLGTVLIVILLVVMLGIVGVLVYFVLKRRGIIRPRYYDDDEE